MLTFAQFPAHIRLMLLTMRWHLAPAEQTQVSDLIASGLDWSAFLEAVTHHRVEPVVYAAMDRLRRQGGFSIPQDTLAFLQQASTVNAFRAALSISEYVRIAEHFARQGFAISLLKGVALSQQVFDSPSVRHAGDIDLLTTPDRLSRQIELMHDLGYDLTIPSARLTPRRLASYVRHWKDATFVGREHGYTVELHWRLFNNPQHPGNLLLVEPSFIQMTPFGRPVRTLSLEDQFLHQAAHGVADAWIYLKSLADVAGYLRKFTDPELEAVLERAERLALLDQVSAAVHLSNAWLGTRAISPKLLPPDHALGVLVRTRTEELLLKHNFTPNRDDPSPASWTRLELAILPGLKSKLEVAARILNRPTLWDRADLPDQLFWLYPVLGAVLPPRRHRPERQLETTTE